MMSDTDTNLLRNTIASVQKPGWLMEHAAPGSVAKLLADLSAPLLDEVERLRSELAEANAKVTWLEEARSTWWAKLQAARDDYNDVDAKLDRIAIGLFGELTDHVPDEIVAQAERLRSERDAALTRAESLAAEIATAYADARDADDAEAPGTAEPPHTSLPADPRPPAPEWLERRVDEAIAKSRARGSKTVVWKRTPPEGWRVEQGMHGPELHGPNGERLERVPDAVHLWITDCTDETAEVSLDAVTFYVAREPSPPQTRTDG